MFLPRKRIIKKLQSEKNIAVSVTRGAAVFPFFITKPCNKLRDREYHKYQPVIVVGHYKKAAYINTGSSPERINVLTLSVVPDVFLTNAQIQVAVIMAIVKM